MIWRCWVHIVGFDGRDIGLESEIWRCWVHIVGFDGRDIGIREYLAMLGPHCWI